MAHISTGYIVEGFSSNVLSFTFNIFMGLLVLYFLLKLVHFYRTISHDVNILCVNSIIVT